MKALSLRLCILLAGAIIGLSLLASPALGQDTGKIDELQRLIEAQQKQIEAQQKQLDEQRQLMEAIQKELKLQAEQAEEAVAPAAAEKAPEKSLAQATNAHSSQRAGLSDADKHDRDSPTGVNVTYFDPAMVVNIPGTKTDIGLHGLVQFQMMHDTVGINNNRFDTAAIPVNGGPSQTKFSVNPTQFALSSATEVKDGQVNTMISMDFNGQLDRPEPRLRIAYGEFVNNDQGYGIIGGQAYLTMLDLKAVPETLDFAGPAGLWQLRQPLLRFTKAASDSVLTEVAVETPENVSYLNASKLTRWPDLVLAGTWNLGGQYFKHLRLAANVRDLNADLNATQTTGVEDSALGWSIGGSTKLGLPFLGAKDNFKINIHYGDGFGMQLKGGPQEGAFNPATLELEPIGIFASYGGIQHFWSEKWRSNLVYGYVDADNPEFVPGNTLDSTNYAAANLVWNPFKTVTLGFEYLWGRRENKNGAAGTSNRYLLSSRYNF